MITQALLISVLVGVVGLGGCSGRSTAVRPEPEPVIAQELMDHLQQGRYDEAVKLFDSVLRSRLPAKDLQGVWQGLIDQLGPVERLGEPATTTADGLVTVVIPVQFRQMAISARVVFTQRKEIAGLWFAPAQTGEGYAPPDYVDFTGFGERQVEVGSGGEWALGATLSIPVGEGPFPALVLVHGSGPNDRDETFFGSKPFRDLAHGLASRGIAVLRYDKRTLVHRAKMTTITPQDKVITDAVLAVEVLRAQPEVDRDRVFALGHSLGGYLAPEIARQAGADSLRGVIILAGSTRPLEDIIIEQVQYIFGLEGELTEAQLQQVATLEAQAARVRDPGLSTDVPADQLPLGYPAEWWLALRAYDPVAVAAELGQPMLILQGERDYQVTMADLARWQTLTRAGIAIKSYPQLNHMFVAGEGMATPAQYLEPSNVAAEVIEDIAAWIVSLR